MANSMANGRPILVQSAKDSGRMILSEITEQISSTHRKDGKARAMIKDICDYCLQYAFVYRSQLGLRRTGKKFGCKDCYKINPQVKADKAIPCWKNLVEMNRH